MGDTGDNFVIYNARIITPERLIDRGWLKVTQGKIAEIGDFAIEHGQVVGLSPNSVNANGQWLTPGFIDIHVHGGGGCDVLGGSVREIQHIAAFHAKHGTTGWLPTTLTAPLTVIEKTIHTIKQAKSLESTGASILGLHLEGPFIAPERKGAQNPVYIMDPSVETISHLDGIAQGLIKKITLAPERKGALEIIKWLTKKGIISSIGHTDGSFEDTLKGIQAGATHATHIFNAMRPLHHREAGTVGALLSSNDVICELIADGHHVHPDVMKLLVQVKGTKKIVLITDAMEATGQPDGNYQLGELDVTVSKGIAYLSDGHTLAGSTLTMDKAVQNMVRKVGVTIQDAVLMAASTPANEIGETHRKGTIEIGKDADMVLLDDSLSVTNTFIEGREVFCR